MSFFMYVFEVLAFMHYAFTVFRMFFDEIEAWLTRRDRRCYVSVSASQWYVWPILLSFVLFGPSLLCTFMHYALQLMTMTKVVAGEDI